MKTITQIINRINQAFQMWQKNQLANGFVVLPTNF